MVVLAFVLWSELVVHGVCELVMLLLPCKGALMSECCRAGEDS